MSIDKNLGHATAYGYAKSKGYTGTEEEFAELMASYAEVATDARGYAEQAEQSAINAQQSATSASTSAGNASASANSASASAQTATTKASEAEQSATSASESASTAVSAKDDAVTAKESAETAKADAETAKTEAVQAAEEATQIVGNKADKDGTYPDMTVGGVMSSDGSTDSTPYLYRVSGGGVEVGTVEEDSIVGGTVAWNQLCNSESVTVPNGHKYLLEKASAWSVGSSTGTAITGLASGTDMLIDFTQMFGSTVADMIYNMETANAGSGVAFFRKLFPKDYYEYNSGELMSVEGVSAHVMRDADDNIIGNYPLDSSLILRGIPKLSDGLYYDGDTYESDGKVTRKYGIVDLGSLTWEAWTGYAGVYRTPLPSNCKTMPNNNTLPNWVAPIYKTVIGTDISSNNKTIGQLHKTYLVVHDDSYSTASDFKTAMNGVYLVYELATPTTESAEPYDSIQKVSKYGTEEYVSTSIVPVGHVTKYPTDIVAKVNGLPSDFSTLIAPTETGFKATRAYSVNQFIIVSNQLYRVTSAIANGATITPNTNVTAVTVADILTSLLNA